MSAKLNLLTQVEPDPARESTEYRATQDYPSRLATLGSAPGAQIGDEQMLQLVRRLFLSPGAGTTRQIVFCGVDNESGSSSICARAGQILAEQTSAPICLIDANPRVRRLSTLLGTLATNPQGCVQLQHDLWLAEIMIGATTGQDLLPLNQVADQLKQLGKEFEYVLIDSPGVNVNSDAVLLGQMAGAAVLVVEAHKTRRTAARRAKQILENAGVRVLGTVLNNRSFPIPEPLYRRI
jgi:protein-tyrosine kinase